MKSIFFIGKGGVGKSTLAALGGLYLARKNIRALLMSMDPAHNLSDFFQTNLSTKTVSCLSGLSLIEINITDWTEKYLDGIKKQMQRSYRYLTTFNLEHHFDVIRHSPAIEEYALLLAFQHYFRENQSYDAIILDMPPTALTLKFFNLPWLSLIWLNELKDLRQHINEKKEAIARIKKDKKYLPDKIQDNLSNQVDSYQNIQILFADPEQVCLMLVSNSDDLSISETKRILNRLRELKIQVASILINKWTGSEIPPQFLGINRATTCQTIPLSQNRLIGKEPLQRFLEENMYVFDSFMPL